MTHRLKKEKPSYMQKNLFIKAPTMQHRQTILSTAENQPLPSTSNNLYSPPLVEVTPSETRRLLAPYSPAFRHPLSPYGETRSVKNQTPLTFENFLARWSGTTFSLSVSLSLSLSRDRWTRVKRGERRGATGWEGYGVLNRVEDGERWERRDGVGVGAAVGKD